MEKRIEKLEAFAVDTKERLVRIETRLDDMASQMAGMASQMATKADLSALQMATKADLSALQMATKAELSALETRMIKWFIGTTIALTSLTFVATGLLR